jgi:hypothetical protein
MHENESPKGSEGPTHAQGREGSIDKRRYTLMLLSDELYPIIFGNL